MIAVQIPRVSGMKERAIYIGRDGDCGLIHGSEYRVIVHMSGQRIFVYGIPYDTICAMNKNWKFLGV